MQIHSAALRYASDPSSSPHGAEGHCREYRRGLDEWFVRFKKLLATLPDNEDTRVLSSWGQFNYHHGIYLISLVWPTPGGRLSHLCEAVCRPALHLARHQQLFARPGAEKSTSPLPIIFPMSWASAQFIFQLSFSPARHDGLEVDKEDRKLAARRCLPVILLLEADPSNLLTGQSFVVEGICDEYG